MARLVTVLFFYLAAIVLFIVASSATKSGWWIVHVQWKTLTIPVSGSYIEFGTLSQRAFTKKGEPKANSTELPSNIKPEGDVCVGFSILAFVTLLLVCLFLILRAKIPKIASDMKLGPLNVLALFGVLCGFISWVTYTAAFVSYAGSTAFEDLVSLIFTSVVGPLLSFKKTIAPDYGLWTCVAGWVAASIGMILQRRYLRQVLHHEHHELSAVKYQQL